MGILNYFRIRVCSGEVGIVKPDVRIFQLAEKRSGMKGSRILYVGDNVENDIKPAKSIGWSAALRLSSEKTSGGLADFEFSHSEELTPFVFQ